MTGIRPLSTEFKLQEVRKISFISPCSTYEGTLTDARFACLESES